MQRSTRRVVLGQLRTTRLAEESRLHPVDCCSCDFLKFVLISVVVVDFAGMMIGRGTSTTSRSK
jgi:hypothetical protein